MIEQQVADDATSLAVPSREEFEALLDESFDIHVPREGTVVTGQVIGVENNQAIIDVGFKTEGRVDIKEFSRPGRECEVKIGDTVEVFLDRIENSRGEAVLSREKANREAAWDRLESANAANEHVEGEIFGRVKGGFSVDLSGAYAFLPGSQVDIRPVHNIEHLMKVPLNFLIVKLDRFRRNIVVSRRAVLEKTTAKARAEVLDNIEKGQVVTGTVKNIVDFGAFVDLGGIDGLLHVTDLAYHRVHHPSEAVEVGQEVEVMVIKVNRETQRISLGMKQLLPDPWEGIAARYPANLKVTGRIANITDFGAFVELEPGVEGLIHVTEMSWTKKNVHPGKIVSTSQEVEVMVLNTDSDRKRISLGLKQCLDNPWETFAAEHPEGSEIEGAVRSKTEFGLFIGLEGGIDGMVHQSDLSWEKSGEDALKDFSKGDQVTAVVLGVNAEEERISLGIKQVGGDPFAQSTKGLKKGSVVMAVVSKIESGGVEAMVGDAKCFIRSQDLSRERSEQRPERFAEGQRVQARVTSIDRTNRKLSISIKAHELAVEKQAVKEYGSSASGAVLGDILNSALRQQQEGEPGESEEAAETVDATEAAGGEEPAAEDAQESEAASDDSEADATPASEADEGTEAEAVSDEPVVEASESEASIDEPEGEDEPAETEAGDTSAEEVEAALDDSSEAGAEESADDAGADDKQPKASKSKKTKAGK